MYIVWQNWNFSADPTPKLASFFKLIDYLNKQTF